MSRLLLLLTLTYTYVKSMPLRPQEGQPVVHDRYNRIPNVGLRSMKEQIMIAAHEQSIQSDKPELPIATDATASATATSCINGFQTYPDTTWNLMGLPYTVAYSVQACIDICNAAGSACAAAQWYNNNACVKFTQAQTVGQVMTSSPDPKLPRTLITRCTASTTQAPATQAPATQAPATQAPATQAPATQAPATKAPTTAPTSSSSCPTGFNTYSGTYDLMGLPYTVAYTATACLNLCQAQSTTTCAAAVWYNGNACVMYTSSQAAGKVVMPSPDPNLPRTVFVRCSTFVTATQAPATQAPATQAPATQAPTKAPTPAPTSAPTQAPTKAPTSFPILTPDTSAPGSHGLPYKGGSVMTNPVRVYLVYYGSWSTTPAKQEAVSIINTFVSNLGTSPWWNIQTTYYYPNPSTGVRTYVQNGFQLGGYVVTPIDSSNGGTSLSDSNVARIISNQINNGKLPYDADGVYIMLSSNEVYNNGFCVSDCGWHSATYVSGSSRIIAYGWVGDATTQCPGSCTSFGSSPSPNNNKAADGIISILAHEIAEAVSDPMLSAWVGNGYQENADKCAWNFLSTYTTSNGARANMNIAGRDYLVQANWKNRDGGACVLRL